MKHVSLLLGVIVILSSCSASWHLKRAKFHEAKAIALGAEVKQDTVFKDVQVITPVRKIDTVVRKVNFRDTVIVTQDRVVTKVKINDVLKTVYVHTDCPSDTIVKKVPIYITKKISAGYSKFKLIWTGISCFLFAFVVGALLSRLLWR